MIIKDINIVKLITVDQGQKLKELIKESGMTQEDFADKMGFSRVYLQSVFKYNRLKPDFINKACLILNVNNNVFSATQNEQTVYSGIGLEQRVTALEGRMNEVTVLVNHHSEAIVILQSRMLAQMPTPVMTPDEFDKHTKGIKGVEGKLRHK